MSALPPPSRRSRRENLPILPRCKSQGRFVIEFHSTNQSISSDSGSLLCLDVHGVRQRNSRLELAAVRIRTLSQDGLNRLLAGCIHALAHYLPIILTVSCIFETLRSTTHHHDRVIAGIMTISTIRQIPQIWRNPPSARPVVSGQ